MMDVVFNRSGGNIERPLEGKDHVSGLLFYCDFATYESSDANLVTNGVVKFSSEKEAQEYFAKKNLSGIFSKIVMHNISSFFGYNIRGELYVCVVAKPSGANLYNEIAQMQKVAAGEIRQIGVWDFNYADSRLEDNIKNIQKQADVMEIQSSPLSVILAPRVLFSSMPKIEGDYKNVSVVVGFDMLDPTAKDVANKVALLGKQGEVGVSSLGVYLGVLSKMKVHESVASVKRARLNIPYNSLAVANNILLSSVSDSVLQELDKNKYLFIRAYNGVKGVYISDSHTLGKGDYNTIESVRTMDKAVRNIRARLIMELGSPLYIDAETGKLDPATVKHLEVVAGKELEVMQKAGEISGWSVEIDPNQDVLGTSTVEFVIKKVPVGVFRKGVVNIGYTKKI